MSEPKSDKESFDDFPLSPTGSQSSAEYYQSFLKFSEITNAIPNKFLGSNRDETLRGLFNELHAARIGKSVLYRKNIEANEAFIALWLSRVKLLSNHYVLMNEIPEFRGISEEELREIAKLSADVNALVYVAEILAEKGIVLVCERSIPGMKLDGAVFKLRSAHPVIGLSLRYPRLDNFWFTLMHELAHVALHYENLDVAIVDDLDESEGLIEKQADRLAMDSFISRSEWRNCKAKYEQTDAAVIEFAKAVGVHPAIVAGRLRRELNKHNIFSDILNAVDVRKVILGDE